MFWGRQKQISHGSGPQYLPGEAPAQLNPGALNENIQFQPQGPETLTSGFIDSDIQNFHLSYGYRTQPDRGGALNYAYELYGLPLSDVCGPWTVARHPYKPIGSQPVAFFQTAVQTSIGGNIPGQVISQPLLDPNNPGAGYDIYS